LREASSLSGISHDGIAEIVDFVERHIEVLLQLLLREEGVLGGNARTDQFGRQLEVLGRETMGRFQTPQCVSSPKILPPPDMSTARACLHDLRARRGALLNRINFGTLKGSAKSIGDVDESLLDTINAARILLDKIHSTRIIFAGEETLTIANTVSGGRYGNIIQVGKADEVHVHHPDGDDDPDPRNLIIATVDILPGSCHADVVVDSDPPYAVTPSGSVYVITLEARTKRAIVLQAARPVVTSRRKPRRACIASHITGAMTPRRFTTDLEAERPILHPEGAPFPFTISSTDVEQFWIEPVTRKNEMTWMLEIDWICAGRRGTALLGGSAGSFELYPSATDLSTKCDLSGHEKDCPALRLRELDPSAPRSTFSSVRDAQNECWLSTIETLGYMS
jgi:hypothetical protein